MGKRRRIDDVRRELVDGEYDGFRKKSGKKGLKRFSKGSRKSENQKLKEYF